MNFTLCEVNAMSLLTGNTRTNCVPSIKPLSVISMEVWRPLLGKSSCIFSYAGVSLLACIPWCHSSLLFFHSHWGKFDGPDNKKYTVMKYEKGQNCYHGPDRMCIVSVLHSLLFLSPCPIISLCDFVPCR